MRWVTNCMANAFINRPSMQVEASSVRLIPQRGPRVPSAKLVAGSVFKCWYANEEQMYSATVISTSDRATVTVW